MSVIFPRVIHCSVNSLCIRKRVYCAFFELINYHPIQKYISYKYLTRNLNVSCVLSKRNIDSNLTDNKKKPSSTQDITPARPVKEKKTYITLIGIDKKISVTTQEDAIKLVNRRDFKLVKVKDYDTKTDRPTYQLMTTSQYVKDSTEDSRTASIKKDQFLKGEKIITVNHKINPHDLNAKVNMMKKWISKRYEVRVVITGDDQNSREDIFKVIETHFKDSAKIVQKREKGFDTRFQVLPLKETVNTSTPAA